MCAAFLFLFSFAGYAQPSAAKNAKAAAAIKVTQIDFEKLKAVLKPNGKPLLVNFWATWCDPCREEFPDLVKLHTTYRDKVDFATISIDDLAEINTTVPKFLREMKSEMPAYLLKTNDDDAAIRYVSDKWNGNLPLTIVYSPDGGHVLFKNAKFKYDDVVAVIDRLTAPKAP